MTAATPEAICGSMPFPSSVIIVTCVTPCVTGEKGSGVTQTFNCNGMGGLFPPSDPVDNCVMPIELSNFTLKSEKGIAKLVWNTASEVDNELFEVMRSYDGTRFEIIGEVNGAATTFESQSYEFVDRTAAKRATSSTSRDKTD